MATAVAATRGLLQMGAPEGASAATRPAEVGTNNTFPANASGPVIGATGSIPPWASAPGPTPGCAESGDGPSPMNRRPMSVETAAVERTSVPPVSGIAAGQTFAPFAALTAYIAAPVAPRAPM